MAELIDKPTMLDWVQKQVEAVTKKQVAGSDGIFTREVLTTMQRNLSAFENAINVMPTTTESEIRAKAIEEFKEETMRRFTELELTNLCYTTTDFKIILREVEEQLKGE